LSIRSIVVNFTMTRLVILRLLLFPEDQPFSMTIGRKIRAESLARPHL
jgi:hypothetical protein